MTDASSAKKGKVVEKSDVDGSSCQEMSLPGFTVWMMSDSAAKAYSARRTPSASASFRYSSKLPPVLLPKSRELWVRPQHIEAAALLHTGQPSVSVAHRSRPCRPCRLYSCATVSLGR